MSDLQDSIVQNEEVCTDLRGNALNKDGTFRKKRICMELRTTPNYS